MPGTDRVVRDGQVAVLVSTSHGAGWSTWNADRYDPEVMMFDAQLIDIVLAGGQDWIDKVRALARIKYTDAYLGGLEVGLQVQWVPQGCLFRVVEYDGAERIELRDRMEWIQA